MNWLADKIEQWPTAKLLPYARNARTHSDDQVAQIAASIAEFGFTNPILAGSDGVIVAGHGRLAAAQKLGLEIVPVVVLDHLSPTQRRAYILADNRLALDAGWDEDMLAEELAALDADGFDLQLTGFSDDELADLLPDPDGKDDETPGDADAVPEVAPEPISVLGDVWVMGRHRLMCGDSTSVDAFDRLMGGARADLIFTDPPYGMSYGGGRSLDVGKSDGTIKNFGMIINDNLRGEELIALVRDAIATATACMKEGGALYACFTWRTYAEFEAALESCGHKVKACIVWDKKSIGLGMQHYRPQHEFIFYCGGQWYGDKSQADVWYMSRGNTGSYVHPTQKPVELIERALNNSSKKGDVVIDCFGGSGSTLIACEATGRHARLMELDPKYVDVIVKRWQEYTGKEATLESTGETFAEVAAGRGVPLPANDNDPAAESAA